MMRSGITTIAMALLIVALLCGCGAEEGGRHKIRDTIVLAKVNGSPITQHELHQNLRASLGPQSVKMLDAAGKRKMLESLVASRAIAQAQEKTLSDDQKADIRIQTAAFREQLLVKMYLAQHVPPQPVSQEMVEQYYRDHPEQFGAKTVRVYEMITSQGKLGDAERDQVLMALKAPQKIKDWAGQVQRLKKKGVPLAYRSGRADTAVLQPQLRDLMQSLSPGQASALTFVKSVAYVVRIQAENKIPARPLKEVSARIRKMLLPVQLKKSVKQASEHVLADAEVEYVKK